MLEVSNSIVYIIVFFNSDNVAYDKIGYDFILVRVRIIWSTERSTFRHVSASLCIPISSGLSAHSGCKSRWVLWPAHPTGCFLGRCPWYFCRAGSQSRWHLDGNHQNRTFCRHNELQGSWFNHCWNKTKLFPQKTSSPSWQTDAPHPTKNSLIPALAWNGKDVYHPCSSRVTSTEHGALRYFFGSIQGRLFFLSEHLTENLAAKLK